MGFACIVPTTGTIARSFIDEMVRFFAADDVGSLSNEHKNVRTGPVARSLEP